MTKEILLLAEADENGRNKCGALIPTDVMSLMSCFGCVLEFVSIEAGPFQFKYFCFALHFVEFNHKKLFV